MSKKTKKILWIAGLSLFGLLFLYTGSVMFSPGTLGSFDARQFKISKSDFLSAFDSLSERQIPDKWQETAASIEYTYKFMHENTCLYLEGRPEEMYFVSYQGNSKFTVISVRSIYKGGKWYTRNDLKNSEIARIENRFDEEVISKIEKVTGTKAKRESY